MLVAGATLGLLAPIAAQASDVINLEEMDSYSRSKSTTSRLDNKTFINEVSEDIANLKGRVDGLEAQQREFEAGGFSDTTTLDGKTIFAVGALENESGDLKEGTMFQYTYQMNLNTSFTGDDNLYVRLKSGNSVKNSSPFATSSAGSYLSSTNTNGDDLKIDKIWYTFPIGDSNTVWIGPRIENYYMHGASPSIYSPTLKQFKLGGNGAAYGASTNTGIGWAYNADNGFSISSNVVSKTAGATTGFLSDESATNWSTQVAYTTDSYHVSFINALKYDWSDSYYSTTLGKARVDNSTNYGLRGYWRPDDSGSAVPEISAGYDISTVDGQSEDTSAYFVGLTWKDTFQADDKIGIAFGQPQTREDEDSSPFTWEAYYSFKPNDSTEVRPTIFGYTDATGDAAADGTKAPFDYTGVVLETTFKF